MAELPGKVKLDDCVSLAMCPGFCVKCTVQPGFKYQITKATRLRPHCCAICKETTYQDIDIGAIKFQNEGSSENEGDGKILFTL